jgi:uncharacterized membrane protein
MNFKKAKWKSLNFLASILLFQLTLYITIIFNIPIVRQAIGLIYLTFIPGLVLVHLLKLNELNIIEIVLFSVSLSIAMSMLTGLFINQIYPTFNITQPLSIIPLLITQSSIVLTGALISCAASRETETEKKQTSSSRHILGFVLSLAPVILGFFSVYALNTTKNNLTLLILITSLSIAFLLGALHREANPKFYPIYPMLLIPFLRSQ